MLGAKHQAVEMAKAPRAIPTRLVWVNQIFAAQAAQNGGVVRRSVSDVKQYGSVALMKREVRQRGFHLIRTGDQYVIFCHKGDLRVIC